MTEIQRSDIAALHHDMRKTPYQANRTLGVLSKMFDMAKVWGLRSDCSSPCLHVKRFKEWQLRRSANPCQSVRKYRKPRRERFLSDTEFRHLGAVLDDILKDGSETRSAIAAVRLLMLTGCRLFEIQKLRWEHVDLEAGELNLPGSKSGGRAVPVAPSTVRLLVGLPREEDNPRGFAGKKPSSHLTDLQDL